MIGQPSVNDLASMFRGNPGPLQARVNQDMQGQPPGALPKDLADVLALQIVTNEQDAAKRNAAMQQLQQMQAQAPQGPQGEPPTIAQSLQEQAKQKLQAQMVQQMRQQQGLQALAQQAPMGAIPEQTPQPQEQPEAPGLDQLPSNMGENYAGGGIIAFSGKDDDQEVPETRDERKVYPGMLPMEGGTVLPERSGLEGMTMGDLVSLIRDKARRYFSSEREAENAAAMYAGPQRAAPGPGYRPTMANDPRMLTSDQGQAMAAADTAESQVGRNVGRTPPARPPVAAIPPAPPAAAAPAMSDREKFLAQQFAQKPDAAAAEQEYASKVGQRPTADLAALADELAARRRAIREREDPLMDFLTGVATAPRGETWMQSGTRGGLYADERRAAREAQDMELLQKLIETKGKITDIEHGYKKEKFTVGRDAANKEYDRVFKAAELMGYDERAAKEMAFKAAEGVLDRQNRLAAARIGVESRGDPAVAAAVNAVKNDEIINSLQKQLEQESKKMGSASRARAEELSRRIAVRQDAIYKAFGVKVPASTIGTGPGASGPGVTAPGWGKAQVVK